MTPTKLRSARALKIGGIGLSTFSTIGGIIGVIERDVFESLLGFADILLGGIFCVHTEGAPAPGVRSRCRLARVAERQTRRI